MVYDSGGQVTAGVIHDRGGVRFKVDPPNGIYV